MQNSRWIMILFTSVLAMALLLPSCKKQEPAGEVAPPPPQTQPTEPAQQPAEQPAEPAQEPAQEPAAQEPVVEQPAAGNLVPLELELPKPMFVGTPADIPVPNLEPPRGEARPPLMVPEGATTNLALDKPVTSSDPYPIIGDLEQVDDGDKEAIDGSWVELGPALQWVQIDLEDQAAIYAIVVWHYHRQARAYHDVIVQLSNDPDFLDGVTTVFNNDYDNSAGMGVGEDRPYVETSEGKLIPVNGVAARYVRLYSGGNTSDDQNHYTEVEVYGKSPE